MIQLVDVYLVVWFVKRGICLSGLQIEECRHCLWLSVLWTLLLPAVLQVKIRTWALPRRLHWSSCGTWAMGQQFLSSRMGAGKMVIIWQTGKAWVNGSNTAPIRTTQMYLGPDQNNYGNLCIVSMGIRSVPFKELQVTSDVTLSQSGFFFTIKQSLFSPASSECALFFLQPKIHPSLVS